VQTTTDSAGRGGVVTVGDRIGDDLFVRLRQQFGAQEYSQLLLEYRLSEMLRLQGSAAEGEGVGLANRSLTRRIERLSGDIVFYYRY
jgi:autotransporter translocation and assembly factor TamB